MSLLNKGTSFKWTEDITKKFIQLRIARHDKFTGKKNSASTEWDNILHILAIDEYVTPEQAKKKWANLCQRYKEIKRPKTELQSDDETIVETNQWPFLNYMEEALTKNASTSSILLNSLVMENGDMIVDIGDHQNEILGVRHSPNENESKSNGVNGQRSIPFKKRKRKAPPRDEQMFMEAIHDALSRIEDKIDQQTCVLNTTMNQLVCCLNTLVNKRNQPTQQSQQSQSTGTYEVT